MTLSKEKKPADPLLGFRCDPKTKSDFEQAIAALGWSEAKTLRALVESFNILYSEHGKDLTWAPVVVAPGSIKSHLVTGNTREAIDQIFLKLARLEEASELLAEQHGLIKKSGGGFLARPKSRSSAPDSKAHGENKTPKT